MTLPRLTFLTRFTLATFAAAFAAAVILAFVLESLHQQSVERDEVVTAVGQIDAKIALPLEGYAAAGHLTPALAAEFRAAAGDATLREFISALRVYRTDGRPVYPLSAPPAAALVAQTQASDSIISDDHHDTRTMYEPFVTGSGKRFVIAIDVVPGQLHDQFAGERFQVAAATTAVVALIFCALVALAAGASREIERRRREVAGLVFPDPHDLSGNDRLTRSLHRRPLAPRCRVQPPLSPRSRAFACGNADDRTRRTAARHRKSRRARCRALQERTAG